MCVRVCVCACVCVGGYFADVLSYWLVQTLGEGQSQTILSPAVGKSRETKRERERGRGGRGQICVLMLIFWSN